MAAEIAEPSSSRRSAICGFRLVRVAVSGRDGKTVQIMAERAGRHHHGRGLRGDLAQLSPLLDAHDPIAGRTTRWRFPRPASTGRWCGRRTSRTGPGYEAKIEVKELIDGRKRFRGMLEGFEDGEVRIEVELDRGWAAGHRPSDRARRRGAARADGRTDSRGAAPRKEGEELHRDEAAEAAEPSCGHREED